MENNTNLYTTNNTNNTNNYENSYSSKTKFEIEKKIREDANYAKQNADKFGEVVDVVAYRSVLSPTEDGGYTTVRQYKLSDGRVVSNEEAWTLCNAGKIRGYIGSHNRGKKHIKAIGDGNVKNNLGNLPLF